MNRDADLLARGRHAVEPFSLAFEAMPYGVLGVAEDGIILFANPVAATVFAHDPAELVGLPLSALIPESFQTQYAELWREFWADPQSRPMKETRVFPGLRKDGVIVPLEIGLHVITEADSRFVVVSLVDITDRLNLEARLAAATSDNLGFQRLVGEIASRLGATGPETLHETVTEVMQQLGDALQLDRAMVWKRHAGESVVVVTHFWAKDDDAERPQSIPVSSIPHVVLKLEAGEGVWFTSPEDVPDPIDRDTFHNSGLVSGAIFPLAQEERGDLGALIFGSTTAEHDWPPAIIDRLRLVAGVMSQTLARARTNGALRHALNEVRELRDRLSNENVASRREARVLRPPSTVVAESPAMKRVLAQVEQVAPTPATVLLLGETGVGKEVLAQAIHDFSPRHQRQMVRVSCAAIPTALIESELFGRERGAYTGALSRQIGRFEAANQSTLFLDEIGELPAEVQVKLLRVLQERVIERLGSTQPVKVDVRIITATNRNLEKAVEEKMFREDLFYRLNVFPIVVPPLRERVEDISSLVWSFVDEFSRMFGKNIESLSADSMRELERYAWPGNVRELRNVIERAIIIATGPQLVLSAPRPPARMPQTAMTLTAIEIDHIRSVLESTNWRVRGRGGAAERLGIKPTTLESRMARLGISRKDRT